MKKALYNLCDEEFAYFVNKFNEQISKREMSYILVGGTAVQAHVLKRLCNKTGKNLEQLISDPNVRLQDFIRSTDDVDLSIDSSIVQNEGECEFTKKITTLLNNISGEYMSPSEENILKYKLIREGVKRPIFQIYINDKTNDEQRISMNIGRHKSDLKNLDSKYYDLFIKDGQKMILPYNSNFQINMNVIKPEHLLASKISKFRWKDTMDIHILSDFMIDQGENINLSEIKELLLPEYEKNYQRFLELAKLEDESF